MVKASSEVEACPECDSANVYRRITAGPDQKDYRCGVCGETFAEPVTRAPK
jgi:predicted RNA-binding Zn-ribbon protein involved in translation (DUF1610 family)